MSRKTNLVVGALTCIVAGASIMTMHLGEASAGEECLAAPKGGASAEQHWRYRTDRVTKRRCWYLSEKGESVSHVAKSAPARRIDDLTSRDPDPTIASRDDEPTIAPAIADVHAELPLPQGRRDVGTKFAPVTQNATAAPDDGSVARLSASDAAIQSPSSPLISPRGVPVSAASSPSEPPSKMASTGALTAVNANPDPGAKIAGGAAPASPPVSVTPHPVSASAAASSWLDAPAWANVTSLSAFFLAAFGGLVVVTIAMGASHFFDRARRRVRVHDREAYGLDWPAEPFRIPTILKLLPHDTLAATSSLVPSRFQPNDTQDPSGPTEEAPDNNDNHDVRQIEQLLLQMLASDR